MSVQAPAVADEITPVWESYVDVVDAMNYLQIDPGPAQQAAQPKVQTFVDMACWWVQDYLGRPIAPTTFVRKFSGYSGLQGSYINLPYYPVLAMNSVVETWGLNGQHTLVYQTAENQGGPGDQMYQMDWVRGTVIRSYQGLIQRPWFPGSLNIEISWVAGYNPIPPTVKTATLELVAYWYRNTQEAPKWFGQKPEYGGGVGSQLWPAVPNKVTELLQPLAQIGIG